jgi:flavin-dependent dehydrogenase
VLLGRGQQILEQLFPAIGAELAAAGAPSLDWGADCPWLSIGGWTPRFRSDLITRTCSRNLLDWLIRRRLAANDRVCFLEAAQVTGLLFNHSRTNVTGVRMRFSNDQDRNSSITEADFLADFVVDASGRNSHSPQWLKTMGYTPPQETVVNSFLGYASRWYQRPTGRQSDWQALMIWPKPPNNTRSSVLFPIEGDRWVLTMSGVGRDYPPTHEAGFLDFARSLRSPVVYEAIKDAQPLSPIYGYRGTENRLRHYERLSRWPECFVVTGDAACVLNPIYGQGMTKAALNAIALEQSLMEQYQRREGSNLIGLAQRFQKQLSKVNTLPWLAATGEDYRWSTTEGGQPDIGTRIMQQYLDQVMLLALVNTDVFKVLGEIMHMLKPPTTLLQPNILVQVLGQVVNWRRKDEWSSDEQAVPKLLSDVVASPTP